MVHFEGDRDVSQSPAELFARLSDARFLVRCIPGAESVAKAEPEIAVCTLRPGFSFVRGTLEITLRVIEAIPATSVRYQVHSRGIGSSNEVEAAVTFAAHESGTRLHWSVDIKALGGLLKAVPQGLIKASAQKVITDLWTAVAGKLSE